VGTAAGVKLARPNQQVICLVGDGSFVFGPTALWNMARLELPVITVVYNNHAYGGPHSRVIEKTAGGNMVQRRQFVHDYLGSPDMNMAQIAKGFGVDGEVAESPEQLRAALGRARKATVEGRPYLIDAQVARVGVAWARSRGFRRSASRGSAPGKSRSERCRCPKPTTSKRGSGPPGTSPTR